MPAAMVDAPNRMEQPRATVVPRRTLSRALSIISPTDVTARIATIVVTVPRIVP